MIATRVLVVLCVLGGSALAIAAALIYFIIA